MGVTSLLQPVIQSCGRPIDLRYYFAGVTDCSTIGSSGIGIGGNNCCGGLRFGIDVSSWIQKACFGFSHMLANEEFITNEGRAFINEREQQRQDEQQQQQQIEGNVVKSPLSTHDIQVQLYVNKCTQYVLNRLHILLRRQEQQTSSSLTEHEYNSNSNNNNPDDHNDEDICSTNNPNHNNNSIELIVVFEGQTPPIKSGTVQQRIRERKSYLTIRDQGVPLLLPTMTNDATTTTTTMNPDESNTTTFQQPEQNQEQLFIANRRAGAGKYYGIVIRELQKVLRTERIPFLVAPYEADSQLIYFSQKGYINCIITEDSDLLINGGTGNYGCNTRTMTTTTSSSISGGGGSVCCPIIYKLFEYSNSFSSSALLPTDHDLQQRIQQEQSNDKINTTKNIPTGILVRPHIDLGAITIDIQLNRDNNDDYYNNHNYNVDHRRISHLQNVQEEKEDNDSNVKQQIQQQKQPPKKAAASLNLLDFTPAMLATLFVLLGCDYSNRYYDPSNENNDRTCSSSSGNDNNNEKLINGGGGGGGTKLKNVGVVTATYLVRESFFGEQEQQEKLNHKQSTQSYPQKKKNGSSSSSNSSNTGFAPPLQRLFENIEKNYQRKVGMNTQQIKNYQMNFMSAIIMYRHPVVYDPILTRCVVSNLVYNNHENMYNNNNRNRKRKSTQTGRFLRGGGGGGDPELISYQPYADLLYNEQYRFEYITGPPISAPICTYIAEGWISPRTLKLNEDDDNNNDSNNNNNNDKNNNNNNKIPDIVRHEWKLYWDSIQTTIGENEQSLLVSDHDDDNDDNNNLDTGGLETQEINDHDDDNDIPVSTSQQAPCIQVETLSVGSTSSAASSVKMTSAKPAVSTEVHIPTEERNPSNNIPAVIHNNNNNNQHPNSQSQSTTTTSSALSTGGLETQEINDDDIPVSTSIQQSPCIQVETLSVGSTSSAASSVRTTSAKSAVSPKVHIPTEEGNPSNIIPAKSAVSTEAHIPTEEGNHSNNMPAVMNNNNNNQHPNSQSTTTTFSALSSSSPYSSQNEMMNHEDDSVTLLQTQAATVINNEIHSLLKRENPHHTDTTTNNNYNNSGRKKRTKLISEEKQQERSPKRMMNHDSDHKYNYNHNAMIVNEMAAYHDLLSRTSSTGTDDHSSDVAVLGTQHFV